MNEYLNVLAIDTATKYQSIALLKGKRLLDHRVERVRYNHGSSLLANIDHLISAQAMEVDDLDLLTVGLGPGSFTGLRVGLATAKALGRATNIPIVGISSLAAMAYGASHYYPGAAIAATIDARRKEVYGGVYSFQDQNFTTLIDDSALSPQHWIAAVEALSNDTIIMVGEGNDAYRSIAQWDDQRLIRVPLYIHSPWATSLAILGRNKASLHGGDDLNSLEPNYIRPSDAKLPDKQFRSLSDLIDLSS